MNAVVHGMEHAQDETSHLAHVVHNFTGVFTCDSAILSHFFKYMHYNTCHPCTYVHTYVSICIHTYIHMYCMYIKYVIDKCANKQYM